MSSEEERAQRFVERHFPEVSRFLARERAGTPVYGPTDPFGDEEHDPDVIVRVDYLLSREQITTALGIAYAEIAADRDPESLPVFEVRHEVEAYLAVQGLHELGKQMERDAARTFPPEQQQVMQLLAEAVERAYPPRQEPAPPVQAPRYSEGAVTLQTLDHGEVTIEEPAWCVGHEGEPVVHRADVTHRGEWRPFTVEVGGEQIVLLRGCISWAPLSELAPEPHPVIDTDLEGLGSLGPEEMREFAGGWGLLAGELYRFANELHHIRRADG